MKKTLALLLSISLLVCSIVIVPAATASAASTGTPGLLYDFTKQANLSQTGLYGTLQRSFDTAENAMKLVLPDDATDRRLAFYVAPKMCVVKDYPIVAIRVKQTYNIDRFDSIRLTTSTMADSAFWGTNKGAANNNGNNIYNKTSWNTFYINAADMAQDSNVFNFVSFHVGTGTPTGTNGAAYVKWVGFFKDTASAEAYAATFDAAQSATAPGQFFDFSKEENLTYAATGGNSKIAYDAKEEAVKVSVKDVSSLASPLGFFVNSSNAASAAIAQYPVFALRVKVTSSANRVQNVFVNGSGSGNGSWWGGYGMPLSAYNGTTEYQTVYVDTSIYKNKMMIGDYCFNGINVIAGGTYAENDAAYVQWAGMFTTVAAAQAYAATFDAQLAARHNPGFVYDLSEESTTSAGFAFVGMNKSFDKDLMATKLTVTNPANNADLKIYASGKNTVMKDYPLLAIRVKVENTDTKYCDTYVKGTGSPEGGEGGCPVGSSCPTSYNGTTEWQTLIVDLKASGQRWSGGNYFYKSNTWYGNYGIIHFDLGTSATIKEGDNIYVQWIGAFCNRNAVDAYTDTFNAALADKTTPGFLYDYSNAANVIYPYGYARGGNTNISYDKTVEAVKLTVKDTASTEETRIESEPNNKADVSIGKYPVIAMRVRTNSATPAITNLYVTGSDYTGTSTFVSPVAKYDEMFGTKLLPNFDGSAEWQTLIFDTTLLYKNTSTGWFKEFSGNWERVIACMTLQENDAVWVKWTGAFTSVAAAERYAKVYDATHTVSYNDAGMYFDFTDSANMSVANADNKKFDVNGGFNFPVYNNQLQVIVGDSEADLGADISEYPYFAAYIKLSNANITLNEANILGTDNALDRPLTWGNPIKAKNLPALQATTDWQLVVFNVTESNWSGANYANGNYRTLGMKFGNFNTDDTVTIKWAGAFAIEKDAYLFCGDNNERKGDINNDGLVDLRDIISYKKYFAGETAFISIKRGDFNGDGKFLANDLAFLKELILGVLKF